VLGADTPTWETEPNSNLEKTPTLALSQRERELTEVLGGNTPTWEIEPNSNLEKTLTLPLSQRERGLTEVSGGIGRPGKPSRTQILKSLKIGSLSLGRGLG